MKKLVLSLMLIGLFNCQLIAQYSTVEDITIQSKELGQTREIMVHTPIYYGAAPNTLYNVIYVFDAHNRRFFDFVSSLAMLSKESDQGFIVVGVKATLIETENEDGTLSVYARNHDLLPEDTKFMRRGKGNIKAFSRYIKNEVIPYIESNYQVLPGRMAVGHSLSASFLTYALINDPDMFDYYVNVSPNVDYDDEFLLKGLRGLDPDSFSSKKYVYMSHGDEFENWGWGPANRNAYAVLREKAASDKLELIIEEHPEENHMSNFIPSVSRAMRDYLETIRPLWNKTLSGPKYNITIRLEVPNEEDVIHISGNQESLGDWAEDKILMKKVSPLVREVTVSVQDHVEVTFFRQGKQAWLKWGEDGRGTYPMMLRPKEGEVYTFEVHHYNK